MTQTAVIRNLRKRIEKHKARGKWLFPPERKLAEELGTSRLTVGKAISMLVGEGLLTRRQGSGTYIVKERENQTELSIGVLFRQISGPSCPHFTKIKNALLGGLKNKSISFQFFEGTEKHFNNPPSTNRILKSLKSGVIDGVIAANRMSVNIIATLNANVPTVVINDIFGETGGITCITCDYWKTGFLAAEYLIKKGHKKIGYISRRMDYLEAKQNLAGFKTACDLYKVNFMKKLTLDPGLGSKTFNRNVERFFKNTKGTAFFARFDVTVVRIINLLLQAGYRIPKDFSFIGAGNYVAGYECDIPLTTVNTHLDLMSEMAIDTLEKKIKGIPIKYPGTTYLLEPEIIERNSVYDLTR